jgi:hypothetical protein
MSEHRGERDKSSINKDMKEKLRERKTKKDNQRI